MSQPRRNRELLRYPHSAQNSVCDWVGTRSNGTAIRPEHRIKDYGVGLLAERVEVLPVIASFLVATLLTLSTLPQSKASMVLKSPEMHKSHQTRF